MSQAAFRICLGCYTRTNKLVAFNKDGTGYCKKCARRSYVVNRPKGMNWREAFHNLVKFGTFVKPEKKKIESAPPAPMFLPDGAKQ